MTCFIHVYENPCVEVQIHIFGGEASHQLPQSSLLLLLEHSENELWTFLTRHHQTLEWKTNSTYIVRESILKTWYRFLVTSISNLTCLRLDSLVVGSLLRVLCETREWWLSLATGDLIFGLCPWRWAASLTESLEGSWESSCWWSYGAEHAVTGASKI